MPDFDSNDQPHFIFLLTPPNSGSTAIVELMNSSHKSMLLQPNGEGQWLIPQLCAEDRWNEEKKVNFESIKAVWLNKYQSAKKNDKNIDFVIEKSPPNMVRFGKITASFENYSALINNRDPYANISSMFHRYHKPKQSSGSGRERVLTSLAKGWLSRSQILMELSEKFGIEKISYEDFCANPNRLKDIKSLPDSLVDSIDFEVKVKVKDYELQGISNQNECQVSKLTVEDKLVITKVLTEDEAVPSYFGYSSLDLN